MKWNLRMKAAERGIWKSTELRRLLAEAGLEISAGKMSMLWATTPTTIRLEDLNIICSVLECTAADLLIVDHEAAAARRPDNALAGNGDDQSRRPEATVTPRLGRNRTLPPA